MKKYRNSINFTATLLVVMLLFCGCNPVKEHQGKKVYETYCSACHQPEGTGLGTLYPPIKDSDYWRTHLNDVPCIIRHGLEDTIQVNGKTYTTPMAGIEDITAFEIANVINYVNANWYPELPQQDIKTIQQQLENCGK